MPHWDFFNPLLKLNVRAGDGLRSGSHKMQTILAAIILLFFCLPLLPAATLEVAPGNAKASDSGPGTHEQPWKTLSKAAASAGPGDTVLIRDGTYRETVVIKTSGTAEAPVVFRVAKGARVVLTGADRITGWKRVEGAQPIFQVPWPHKFIGWSKTMTHPGDEYHRLIGRCEQVIVDGYLLRQVLEREQLAPGTFFADTSNEVLFAWDTANRDLNKTFAEASVRSELLRVEGPYVQLKGVHFRYAANMAQHGAAVFKGAHDQVDDCTFEQMNSSGASFEAPGQVVSRCVFRDNGQIGFGANGAHQLLFTECLVENNNVKGFDRGWEAGGDKLVLTRGAILEHSRFMRNRGNGIWFDIGNEECTVRNCYIADNEDSGIFYEISFGLHASDNVISGNGFANTAGAWGAQAGISLSSSPHCVIERNMLVSNREGFNFREQDRTTPRIGSKEEVPVWNHDQVIRNNIIAFNRDAQIWGWFDTRDGRHWPSSEKVAKPATGGAKPPDLAEPYRDRDQRKQPAGLNLEKLNLQFQNNVYFAAPGQGAFHWGVTWGVHKNFPTLAEFQSCLAIDHDSQERDPEFIDSQARDFRIPPTLMQLLKSSYPKGQVPEARLGEVRVQAQ